MLCTVQLHIFALSFDWLTGLPVSFVTGQNESWGSDLTALEHSIENHFIVCSGELFAKCPVDDYPGIAVEGVLDSSRYFVLKIVDETGMWTYLRVILTKFTLQINNNYEVQWSACLFVLFIILFTNLFSFFLNQILSFGHPFIFQSNVIQSFVPLVIPSFLSYFISFFLSSFFPTFC